MKPIFFTFCLIISSYTVFSHTTKEEFDYSIVFGGCFDKDTVSLKINNTSIFDHYHVDNSNPLKKGNLSLTQDNKNIRLFYNGQQKFKSKVKFSFYLNLEVTVNRQVKNFKIDLRKGKVILVEFCSGPEETVAKRLTIQQMQDEVIFM